MPSSWSASLRFELQFTGENINLWGDKLNTDLQHADYAIAGWLTKAITGDYALTTANAADDEARAAMIKFTGALALNATVTIPSVSKSYFLYNATNKILTITTGAGSTVSIDAGDKTVVFCDGSTVHTLTFGGLDLKSYITAFTASAGSMPSALGNAGKYTYSDGANVLWRQIVTGDIASFAAAVSDIWQGTNNTKAVTALALLGSAAVITLTDAATVTPDFGSGANFTVTLGGNRTLANPANIRQGWSGIITVKQDGTGSRTLAYGSGWKFPGGTPALSTAASAADTIAYYVEDAAIPVVRAVMAKAYS